MLGARGAVSERPPKVDLPLCSVKSGLSLTLHPQAIPPAPRSFTF